MKQPMVTVLDEEGGRVLERSRPQLEWRDEHVQPGRIADSRRCALDRVARHLDTASRANRAPDRREQQSQVIVYLCDGADRRARILDRVFLAQRERRWNIRNRIDVRPLHPLQEEPRVRRQALHVAPLPLGVDRVEHEARFTRARHARYDGELAMWKVERDVAKVVSARAANTD